MNTPDQNIDDFLCNDILLYLSDFLDYVSLVRLMMVCKRFYSILGPHSSRKEMIAKKELDYIKRFFESGTNINLVGPFKDIGNWDTDSGWSYTYKEFTFSIQPTTSRPQFFFRTKSYLYCFPLRGSKGDVLIADCDSLDLIVVGVMCDDVCDFVTSSLCLIVHPHSCILKTYRKEHSSSDCISFTPNYYKTPLFINKFISSNPCDDLKKRNNVYPPVYVYHFQN